MAITQAGSNTFVFSDGGSGHSCNLGTAPAVGDWDVLAVNSDTVVSTPSGFTSAVSRVANQGAYFFTRKATGGETSTVSVTTSGNFSTEVSWSRWSGADALDVAVSAGADASAGSTTPAVDTGVLAAAGELVVAFGAIHGATTTSPSWFTGYTALTSATQGSGASTATGYVAYKLNAGTAAETPNVSWTTPAPDRYILVVTFTATSAASLSRDTADAVTTADAPTRTLTSSRAATDTVTVAESPVRLVAAARSTSDTLTVSETPTASLTASRIPADSLTLADGGARTLQTARQATDTLTVSESVSSAVTRPATAADALTLADIGARTLTLPRSASDALHTADAATGRTAASRALTATLMLTDTATGTVVAVGEQVDITVAVGAPFRGWSVGPPTL